MFPVAAAMPAAPAPPVPGRQWAALAAIAVGALAVVVAVGVLLTTLTPVANTLRAAVVVTTACLPLLVALLWRRRFGPTRAIVQTHELTAALGRSEAGGSGSPALRARASGSGRDLLGGVAAGEANALIAAGGDAFLVATTRHRQTRSR